MPVPRARVLSLQVCEVPIDDLTFPDHPIELLVGEKPKRLRGHFDETISVVEKCLLGRVLVKVKVQWRKVFEKPL